MTLLALVNASTQAVPTRAASAASSNDVPLLANEPTSRARPRGPPPSRGSKRGATESLARAARAQAAKTAKRITITAAQGLTVIVA